MEGFIVAQEDLLEMEAEIARLCDREQQLNQRIQELELEQQRHVEESLRMQKDLDQHREDLAREDSAKRVLAHQDSAKDSVIAELTMLLAELEDRLEAEVKSKSSLQRDLEEQRKRHQAESEEKNAQLQILVKEKDQVLMEKEELQNITEGFCEESESILQEYVTIAQRLKVANDQHQNDMKEHARMLERIHLSEQSHREQEERLEYMFKIFQEDFERERNSRETAVKVKILAEERMKKMDKELMFLKERLNQQPVQSLREKPGDQTHIGMALATQDIMKERVVTTEVHQSNLSLRGSLHRHEQLTSNLDQTTTTLLHEDTTMPGIIFSKLKTVIVTPRGNEDEMGLSISIPSGAVAEEVRIHIAISM